MSIRQNQVARILVFAAAVLTGLAYATLSDHRVYAQQRPDVDDEELVEQREEFIATLRGLEEGQPFDYGARIRAIEFMNAQQQFNLQRRDSITNTVWTELGPNPIPNGQTQTTVVPVSGRVTAIEVDPSDPSKVYVGTAQGGVYRSLDGGATWTPLMDSAQSLAVGALALDAANGRLYVGTGEANGSADSFGGVGIYRIDSVNTSPALVGPINPVRTYQDAGNAPQNVAVFTGRSISKILIVPNDPTTLFVGTAGGQMGIGGDSTFGGTIPPLGLRGLYKLTNATGAAGSVGVQRIGVRSGSGIEGCFDIPCTGNRNINDMVFDPGDATGNTLIVWLNGTNTVNDGGVWRTANALAATPAFTQSFATTSTTTSNGRGALVIYKQGANPAVVYAASGEPSSGTSCPLSANAGALRRSTDGGASFGAKLNGGGGFCGGQCFYNIAIAVLPGATTATTDDQILLGGNVRDDTNALCQRMQATSTDGGNTFTNHDGGLHADSHAIKIAPSNSQIVYRGDDGGIFKSTDGGSTWTSLNNATFRATQFSSIAVHPTDPNFTIGGTQDNGTDMLLPSGTSWNRIDFGDGGYALIDQGATDTTNVTMYHTYFNQQNNLIGFARVTTTACAAEAQWAFRGIYTGAASPTVRCGGFTDTFNGISISDTVNFYAPMALGPGSPNTVYFGSSKLYRSVNKGDSMSVVSQTMADNVSSIAISPQDDNYRLIGLNNGGLFFTATGSSTLTNLDAGNAVPDKYVGRVLFDPTNKNTAYIGLGGYMGGVGPAQSHVWKVTNLGATPALSAINGSGLTGLPDVPVNGLAVDPLHAERIFVGTDIGVYGSSDSGATWAPLGTGLPRVAVFGMEIQNAKRVLRVATHGRGLWEIGLDAPAVPSLLVSAGTISTTGQKGGPFVPASFNFTLSASVGSVDYAISGVPSWLTASATAGTVTNSGSTITLTVNGAANALDAGSYPASIAFANTTNGQGNTSRTAALAVTNEGDIAIFSAVLPASRSVMVGTAATAFATIINSSPTSKGINCGLSLGTSIPAVFGYQTTDPATNAVTGAANLPSTIDPNKAQSFVFSITPSAAFAATDVTITAKCANSGAAPTVVGLNTLLLSASTTPTADVVALAATPSNDGIVNIPGTTGTGVFATATVNVGATDTITVSADTGSATLPVVFVLCQTNPADAQCLAPPAATVTTSIASNATPTFSIFVTGSGDVAFDPANNRAFVRFKDGGGTTRGSTSVAIRTQSADKVAGVEVMPRR